MINQWEWRAPKCCLNCKEYVSPAYGDFGGAMTEDPWCRRGVFFPKKQTCKRQVPVKIGGVDGQVPEGAGLCGGGRAV